MAFTNSYKLPPLRTLSSTELYGPEEYDVNFIFPLNTESFENERVKLTPFIPRIHAEEHWANIEKNHDMLRYYPTVWPTVESFLTWHETLFRAKTSNTLFAILDKTRPDPVHPERLGSLAGMVGLYNSSDANLCTEIAYLAIYPEFQRTHVASNTVGILLNYCLELPSASPGLGLRRVQWCAHEKNIPSVRLAERMGFKREGVIRWQWVLPEVLSRDGMKPSENDKWPEKYGRHTVVLSICWDDWEEGGRGTVGREINRVQ